MKILVTVGTQLPFDRLVGAMDAWAAANPDARVFAQIGEGGPTPRHLAFVRTMPRPAFVAAVEAADAVVAHAGIGSVLTALDAGKPLVVMPRRADLGEHRNDHQAATAAELGRFGTVTVVHDAGALAAALGAIAPVAAIAGSRAGPAASPMLVSAVRDFIAGGRAVPAPPLRAATEGA